MKIFLAGATGALGRHGDGVEIIKLGGRKDGGVDIKLVRAGGQTTLIQTRLRTDFTARESVDVVRALYGVMLRDGVPSGW